VCQLTLTLASSNEVNIFEVGKQPLVYLVPWVANPMTTGLLTKKMRKWVQLFFWWTHSKFWIWLHEVRKLTRWEHWCEENNYKKSNEKNPQKTDIKIQGPHCWISWPLFLISKEWKNKLLREGKKKIQAIQQVVNQKQVHSCEVVVLSLNQLYEFFRFAN
jgi:hypothetical protein